MQTRTTCHIRLSCLASFFNLPTNSSVCLTLSVSIFFYFSFSSLLLTFAKIRCCKYITFIFSFCFKIFLSVLFPSTWSSPTLYLLEAIKTIKYPFLFFFWKKVSEVFYVTWRHYPKVMANSKSRIGPDGDSKSFYCLPSHSSFLKCWKKKLFFIYFLWR